MWIRDLFINAVIVIASIALGMALLQTLPRHILMKIPVTITLAASYGGVGILLMFFGIQFEDKGNLIELTSVPLMVAALFTTPVIVYLTAAIIVAGRILFFEANSVMYLSIANITIMAVFFVMINHWIKLRWQAILCMNFIWGILFSVICSYITQSILSGVQYAISALLFTIPTCFVSSFMISSLCSYLFVFSRKAVDQLEESILVVNKHRILYINDSGSHLLGDCRPTGMQGTEVRAWLPKQHYRTFQQWFDKLHESKTSTSTRSLLFPRKDGARLKLRVRAEAIYYNGYPALRILIQNRTRLHQKDQELLQSEERFRTLVENALIGVFVLEEDHRFQYVNPYLASQLGYRPEEVIGTVFTDYFCEDEVERASGNYVQRMHGYQNVRPWQYRLRHKNGEIIHVEGVSATTRLGDKTAVIGTVQNITEKVRSFELLQQAEKLSVVGQLAAGVAHEIRNPITALKGFLQLMKSRPSSNYTEIMNAELDRINLILGEFLYLARPTIPSFQKLNLVELIQDVVSLMSTHAILHNVAMNLYSEEPIVEILGDIHQLKQACINLTKNAIESMDNAGTVKIYIIKEKHHAVVRIIDQGSGIPADILDRLGSPFLTTKENGTGLGMMICKQILELHHSHLIIRSTPDEGTTVEFSLQLVQSEDKQKQPMA